MYNHTYIHNQKTNKFMFIKISGIVNHYAKQKHYGIKSAKAIRSNIVNRQVFLVTPACLQGTIKLEGQI